jgi:hypothetical protein
MEMEVKLTERCEIILAYEGGRTINADRISEETSLKQGKRLSPINTHLFKGARHYFNVIIDDMKRRSNLPEWVFPEWNPWEDNDMAEILCNINRKALAIMARGAKKDARCFNALKYLAGCGMLGKGKIGGYAAPNRCNVNPLTIKYDLEPEHEDGQVYTLFVWADGSFKESYQYHK